MEARLDDRAPALRRLKGPVAGWRGLPCAGALIAAACLAPVAASAEPWEDAPLLEETDQSDTASGEPERDPTPSVLVAEFGLDERNVVLSAARTRTTIQEAPAIVTVITAEEIKIRGYRTVNDLLQTIPGFEGDRWDFNGWTQESFARGNPRGLLVLLNGVSIVEPARNQITLDRKIPLEAIKRVEIVSGPGGVLWGSNALLGVVNIITRSSDDLDGFEVMAGAGGGPGEQQAAKAGVSWGGRLLDGRLRAFTHLSIFTSLGPELEVNGQKIIGVLPEPADDGLQLFVADSGLTSDPSREFHFNWMGQVSLDALTLEWMLPFERDARQVSGGGALLNEDYRADKDAFAFDAETIADDSVSMVALQFKDRFNKDAFGLSAKGYLVKWNLDEDPLGAFPPSDLSPTTQVGFFTQLKDQGQYRYGLNLDMDASLPLNNRLIFGGEVFQDRLGGLLTTGPISDRLLETLDETQRAQTTEREGVTFLTEPLTTEVVRTIGAIYLVDEFKASATAALSGGARLQLSDSYDPTALFGGALVVNLIGETYLKLNYTEGFRPPDFQSTHINDKALNQLTFLPNPDLDVERSRAGEFELNTVLLKGGELPSVDRLYLRADYSVSQLEDIIVNDGGRFRNSGTRLIHSAELLARLELRGDHEIWAAYYFVDVDDDELGKLRQIANHVFNAGARAMILPELWEMSALITLIGPREDRNRLLDPTRPDLFGFTPVRPTDVVVERLPTVVLLRVGARLLDLGDLVTLSAYGYNVLDQQWDDPDLFFDDGVAARPYPRERFSFFVQAEATF